MLARIKKSIRKFLGLEAKPDAEDDEAKAEIDKIVYVS